MFNAKIRSSPCASIIRKTLCKRLALTPQTVHLYRPNLLLLVVRRLLHRIHSDKVDPGSRLEPPYGQNATLQAVRLLGAHNNVLLSRLQDFPSVQAQGPPPDRQRPLKHHKRMSVCINSQHHKNFCCGSLPVTEVPGRGSCSYGVGADRLFCSFTRPTYCSRLSSL